MKQTFIANAYKTIQPPSLPSVPTMITDDEKKYLYWLGRDVVAGKGAIVEIGTWFGCSAGYLGAGLRDAGKEIPFYCFDRFELQGIEKRKAREQGFEYIEQLEEKTDIMPLTAEHLREIYPIHLCKTYIDQLSWPVSSSNDCDGFIELLHLDAPKRESDILHALKTFVPYLMPGKSILVLQDFGMPRAYALPLIFGALGEYFELVDIPSENSTMAVFVYKKELENVDQVFRKIIKNGFDFADKPALLTTSGKETNPLILSVAERNRMDSHNINFWPTQYAQGIWQKMASNYSNPEQKAFFNFGLALYFFRRGDKALAVKIAKENAPYLSVEKAELLDKRLCTRLWKLAFKR